MVGRVLFFGPTGTGTVLPGERETAVPASLVAVTRHTSDEPPSDSVTS